MSPGNKPAIKAKNAIVNLKKITMSLKGIHEKVKRKPRIYPAAAGQMLDILKEVIIKAENLLLFVKKNDASFAASANGELLW